MKGYKDSTKTTYIKGGPKGGPRGAAASRSAMKAFKESGVVTKPAQGGRAMVRDRGPLIKGGC